MYTEPDMFVLEKEPRECGEERAVMQPQTGAF